MIKILGIDPGMNKFGYGVIMLQGSRIIHLENAVVRIPNDIQRAKKLAYIYKELEKVYERLSPDEVAIEEVFVNSNSATSLHLGEARGIALMMPALKGIHVSEYTPNFIKKNLCGNGHASKEQVLFMVNRLLPLARPQGEDASDALAVALVHAQMRTSKTYQLYKQHS